MEQQTVGVGDITPAQLQIGMLIEEVSENIGLLFGHSFLAGSNKPSVFGNTEYDIVVAVEVRHG
jgi:hypothetical protein